MSVMTTPVPATVCVDPGQLTPNRPAGLWAALTRATRERGLCAPQLPDRSPLPTTSSATVGPVTSMFAYDETLAEPLVDDLPVDGGDWPR